MWPAAAAAARREHLFVARYRRAACISPTLSKRSLLTASAAALGASLVGSLSAGAVSYADYMCHLINIERRKASVDPVVLGTNRAAQMHADSMVKFCHSGHWGVDGLKPYMRYSLTGGYQNNAENSGATQICYLDTVANGVKTTRGNVALAIHRFVSGFMNNPGHKETMLDDWYRKVNIGLAWDAHNIVAINHFEGDFVHFSKVPAIEGGRLSMAGRVKNDVASVSPITLVGLVTYDPPPKLLTIGQLERAGPYADGKGVGWLAPQNISTILGVTQGVCLTPYDLPEDTVVAQTSADSDMIFQHLPRTCVMEPIIAPTLPADRYVVNGTDFAINADISSVLSKWGNGVYTVALIAAELELFFSKYSIFYGIEPPVGYR